MKISVHLEADSAEELMAFFETFHVKQLAADDIGLAREGAVIRSKIEAPKSEQPAEDTFGVEQADELEEALKADAIEALAEQVAEPVAKKARKPRGPNKKKDAPAEPAIDLETPAPKAEAQPNGEVTREDLLAVFGEYVQRYGVSFGYTDISTLLQKTLGDGIRKASDVPDEAIGKAVEAIRGAITANPFNRKRDYA